MQKVKYQTMSRNRHFKNVRGEVNLSVGQTHDSKCFVRHNL